MSNEVVMNVEIDGLKKLSSGKVREMFDMKDKLLIVATDRISAFDVVMHSGIPRKGAVLTQLSAFWLEKLGDTVSSHLITAEFSKMPKFLTKYKNELAGRTMFVKKAKMFPVECVVRGYISGSAWKEYKQYGTVCGLKLPANLKESERLPEPIFTPATKAVSGHDENISYEKMCSIVGREIAQKLKEKSIEIYNLGADYALSKGVILADTKFEWGWHDGEIILCDEILTPDSSRFWPLATYKEGDSQPSFDKQFLRDYLESINWDKSPPAPELPQDIVTKTSEKYLEAYRFITGQELC